MKKQNDNINSDSAIDNSVEYLHSDGEKLPTAKSDRLISDEVNDYVFVKSHRKKKKKKHSYESGSENYELVKSDRSNNKSRRSYRKVRKPRKKMKKWKKVLLIVTCTLLSLVVCVAGIFTALYFKGVSELFESKEKVVIKAPEGVDVQNSGEYVYYKGKTYEYNSNITSMLFMGVDKQELGRDDIEDSGGQADVLVLFAIDTKTGKTDMINISRDTMTDVYVYSANGGYVGTEKQQICLSYAYGDGKERSCEYTVRAVQTLFYNIPIKSYLSLDIDGIAAVNDSVGGVDVTSPETIGEFVQGQSYHLVGAQAESFIRSRSHETAEANNLRMERQKIYVNSFMDKVIEQTKADITTPISLFNDSAPYTCTNLSPSKISYLAGMAATNNISFETKTVPGQVKMGEKYAEFYVDETNFYEMFLDIFYNEVKK